MNYEEVKELVITIFIWFYPFIFIFGIIGNVLAFLTFSRKKFAKMSFSIYFRFLAFTDSIALVAAINNFAKYRYDWAIADQSAFLCKTIHYMCDSIELSSGNSLFFFVSHVNFKPYSDTYMLCVLKPGSTW